MPMSEGQLKSLAVVAAKLRDDEAPLKAEGNPRGLGVGAAALLVEMAGDEIKNLRERVSFALNWADGIPRLASNPKCYVLSADDLEAFKSALRS